VVTSPLSKPLLREELARALASHLAVRERAYHAARDAATHDEAKPENDKDTRALEQSYLAHGEALRIEELRLAVAEVQSMAVGAVALGEPVRLGALVTTEEDGTQALFWLAPHGGGTRLSDGAVQVLTPMSPLGGALLGKRAGDDCEILVAGKRRALTVVGVQ
jgi:transcription elongation GreA/GreB family factor